MSAATDRLERLDWDQLERDLDQQGHARIPRLLGAAECAAIRAHWAREALFRKQIDMERHRFGRGEYRYYARPLPRPIADLREAAYPMLAAIANRWAERLGSGERYPPTLAAFARRCAARGQEDPTPLVLHYTAGGYNCLHQDLYGEIAFPLQLAVFLSRPGADYRGGEFLLVEQRPRRQSVGIALTGERGEAVVFPNRFRPVPGARGHSRATVRHGVSRLLSGERFVLGIIFHDAR